MFNTKILLTVAFLFVLGFVAFAQPSGPNATPTPFGGVALLAAAAAAYGGKKAYDKNKMDK